MSSHGTPAPAGDKPAFTDRELELLGFAMRSLKSGPPEIDYEKLAALAGMSNPRSASNAWAKIKQKLMADPGVDVGAPKPGRATKKKAAAKAKDNIKEEDEADELAPVKKTAKKRGPKAQDVDGEGAPKKKPRGRPAKKAVDTPPLSDSEAADSNVKKEADESPVNGGGDEDEDVI
ncbi:hypothetical protein P154DRAFT_536976 [Amniculicola lignicola CBS 123094]|uniref:Uncharacterized protein n=1 Tax=Amniculicola lignicola CBS 123094 TaxID=1392246 RepID=A0A6A5W9N2_9PLEO|nr:hypothetical protein P154DRAFT_536976 [Amniculicola lignicola CBS 123094]